MMYQYFDSHLVNNLVELFSIMESLFLHNCYTEFFIYFSVNQGPPPPRPWIQLSSLEQGRPTGNINGYFRAI